MSANEGHPDTNLHELRARIRARESSHRLDIELAHDGSVATDTLVQLALAAGCEDGHGLIALCALQRRATEEVIEAAKRMMESGDVVERVLGSKILREAALPRARPHQRAREFVRALERAIADEQDTDALSHYLSAINWQQCPEGLEVSMRYIDDPRATIRATVVEGFLPMIASGDSNVQQEAIRAMLHLARDPDEWIVGSVLYDVAASPELFRGHIHEFAEVAKAHLNRSDRLGVDARSILEMEVI